MKKMKLKKKKINQTKLFKKKIEKNLKKNLVIKKKETVN